MAEGCPVTDRHLVGDPVDVVTGANSFREVDFELDGPLPLVFYRHYDSRWSAENRGLGPGFRHGFEHWLRFDLDGVTFFEPDGTERHFRHLTEDGQREPGGGCWLERDSEERYVLSRHGRPTLVFRRPPRSREAELVEMRQTVDGVDERIAFAYDDGGRLTKILTRGDVSLRLEWDEAGQLYGVQRRDPDGSREWMVRYHYERGYLTAATDFYGHHFRLQYGPDGRVSHRVDRQGFAFWFEYDAHGRCISSTGEDGTLAVQLTYKPSEYTTVVMDANGGDWVYQYDKSGAVILITDPYGGSRYFKTGADGRLLREYDESGACTRYLHDDAGAATAKVDPDGRVLPLPEPRDAPDPSAHRLPRLPIEWELGDRWERGFRLPDPLELPHGLPTDVRQALTTSEDLRRGTVETVTDVQGHRVKEGIETGHARHYAYNKNGGLAEVVDMDGGAWKVEISGWNDICAEVNPLGGRTTYRYTSSRALSEVVDAAGTSTEYERDLKDRLTKVSRNGEVRESYAYDAAGHLVEKRDALGEVMLKLERDTAGRIVERDLGSGEHHSLRYDDRGRLVEALATHHACTFAYDHAGRRTEDKRDGKGVAHRFVGGEIAQSTVLDRFRTEYHALDDGTVVLVDPAGATHRLRSHGRGIFTRDFANGLSETTQYHPRGGRVLARVLHAKDDAGHAWARRYQYTPENHLALSLDSEAGPTRYEHDAAHRLERATHADGRVDEYRYNAAGTLFQSPTLGQATVGKGNRLRYASGEQYEYNHRHHLSQRVGPRGTISYDYDSRDQLSVVFWEGPNGERWGWDAEYDALGRRIRKAPGYTNDTHYYWDTDRLAAEVFHDGRVRVYVYPDAFAVVPMLFIDYDSVDAPPESGERHYVLADQRGCVERVLDDEGAVKWKAKVDPYGFARVEVGQDFHQPLRFPGHFHDPETGLHYNRFRYYDPQLGRYLESDPVGLWGGLNVYAYTQNPLTQVDLRGLSHDPSPTHSDAEGESLDGAERDAQPGTHGPGEESPSVVIRPIISVGESRDAYVARRMQELRAQGHGPQRHEGDVTPQQLHDRAIGHVDPATGVGSGPIDPMTGTTTDGVHGGTHRCGRDATRITSEDAYVRADDAIRGSPEFATSTAAAERAGQNKIPLDVPLSDIYGGAPSDHLQGVSRGGSAKYPTGNPPGSAPASGTDFEGGSMRGVYRRSSSGEWDTYTMFPNPKSTK